MMLLTKAREIIQRAHQFEVPINQCVHFCGFRYGVHHYNPYETYLIDLKNNVPIQKARRRFIHFLQYYRPRHMGEALGLSHLAKQYPLWLYPWQHIRFSNFHPKHGWFENLDDVPDILTHFCEKGILSHRIDQEFFWGEQALHAIATNGYIPGGCNSFVKTYQFTRKSGTSIYLLLDGNHRVSAMSALGYKVVQVQQKSTHVVFEVNCDEWYGVKNNFYEKKDALQIFNSYFEGNFNYQTTSSPAKILGFNSWEELYG